MNPLPTCQTLLLEPRNGVLFISLNRPQNRNAMSLQMVAELRTVMAAVRDRRSIRALVLRGTGEHFCAGGDLKDMAGARAHGSAAYRELNRAFGALLEEAQHLPQVLVCVLQGAVLGGGFGLACVSDIAIAEHSAQFGMPETSLGLLPAQIAPFVVQRIGLAQARRLALTAARFDGAQALGLGLVQQLSLVLRCAPGANAATKALLLASIDQPQGPLLDQAANDFANAVLGEEGVEGTLAFVQKRKPAWAN